MVTEREKQLVKIWMDIKKRDLISLDKIDDLMDYVAKVLDNLREAEKSRDKWKQKYQDLKLVMLK